MGREVKIGLNRVRHPGTSQHVLAASSFGTSSGNSRLTPCSRAVKLPRAAPQSVHSYLHPRSQRPHQGVDILCSAGSTVYAPFTGMIVGQEKPYQNKNAINNGVRISGRGKRGGVYTWGVYWRC